MDKILEHLCTNCGRICDCERDMSECDWCLTCDDEVSGNPYWRINNPAQYFGKADEDKNG